MAGTPPSRSRVLILGGGLSGTLAAAALAPHGIGIDIVERHALPDTPRARRGLPQARHAHMLWSGGADAIESLLPGTLEMWLGAGAHRIPIPNGMVSFSPGGWYRRCWPEAQYLISAGRDLVDWAVRTRALALPGVRLLSGAEPVRLLGTRTRVTGAVIRHQDGTEEVREADLVIDATGRASRAPSWLAGLGIPVVPETVVDAGVAYASRRYKAPVDTAGWPVINIQVDARLAGPGSGGTILPIEGGEWMVSLAGTRGGQPTSAASQFLAYARNLRSPLIAEFLDRTEPIGPVTVTRNTANRRRHYEKIRVDGFVALGDSATALNPIYGHGMSAAAQGARALRELASTSDITSRGFARRAQRAIARPAAAAWLLAVGQDAAFPRAIGKKPTLADRAATKYVNRLVTTACSDFTVVEALTDVMTLQASGSGLAHPRVLLAAIRGPRLPPLAGPALTPAEQAVLLGRPAPTPTPTPTSTT
ncbi:FAD-dependent monooxygenase [Streptomyces sp. Isolate_45]|uniref:FAD-dependent oxidoreductase n=1 Tax=Streptomyces sp. Isolate_45 TaxID=2950111 RepID=UPI002481E9F5|nr:FAD-dependent monooxygenase [Streptomyces sp. Isolate_45]MDA5282733.1 FAD-dependent monooxygenase [Streptomyces sp. Isolate_45]